MSENQMNNALQQLRKKRRKKWIISAIVVLALGGGGAAVYSSMGKSDEPAMMAIPNESIIVERGDITETLSVTGTVKASKEVNLNFNSTSTDKLAEVNVKIGDQVKQGQLLGRLNDTEAKLQIQNAEDALRMARSKLADATKGPKETEVELQEMNVQKAAKALETAKSSYELQEAENQLKTAQSDLEMARKTYEDQKFLSDSGAISAKEMTEAEQAWEKAQASYDTTELQMRKTRDQIESSIEDAEMSYRTAQLELKKLKDPPEKDTLENLQIDISRAETDLEQKRSELNKLQITAPWDGVILKVNGDVGTSPTAPFIVMNNSNSSDLKVATKINQSDIVKVKTGQKAILTTTAYPGEEFEGTVTFISPEVSADEGVNAYAAELSITNSDNKLKTGMIMNIAVELSKVENVLFVPVTAIQSDGGADGVYVAADPSNTSAYEFKPVELGLYTTDRVELKSGVNEGDTVVIPAPGGAGMMDGSAGAVFP
ncbi:efflux RND transporter periplasmic adaptor subunit [Paenibacillus massiliensis]|uniref:efflux RND transporter periplasmic adaptor subunit n=2 Tax=Paenibacillus massiliensis TaxID=225917 RepID=UPI00036E03D7|nr:efflux RND transporter periplasmic adaptor subunit [Paenibacillus massiliensis]